MGKRGQEDSFYPVHGKAMVLSITDEEKEYVLRLVLGSAGQDVKEQLTRTLESFSEADKAFLMGYLEGYADAFAVIHKAQKDMEP